MLRSVVRLLRIPLADVSYYNPPASQSNAISNVTIAYKHLHTTRYLQKLDDHHSKKTMPQPKVDEGTEGENSIDIDRISGKEGIFPDENTPDTLFEGMLFKHIPIINIRVTLNNTIITVTDFKGTLKALSSCGVEGFKNAKKGTNVAAQATAISISTKAIEMGYKTVRVKVRGLGPGRMSAIKGLEMGGLNIVSITDATRVTWNPLRARKPRRL